MEERPLIWRVAVNILNKQLRTSDKWWSSSLRVGRVARTPHHKNISVIQKGLRPGLILWFNPHNGKGHEIQYLEC